MPRAGQNESRVARGLYTSVPLDFVSALLRLVPCPSQPHRLMACLMLAAAPRYGGMVSLRGLRARGGRARGAIATTYVPS